MSGRRPRVSGSAARAAPSAAKAAVVLAVAALLGACAGVAGPSGRPSGDVPTAPVPTAVPTAPPAQLPIEPGVTPSTDEVVVRVSAVPDVIGAPYPPTVVYADGSVLVPDPPGADGPAVRRLSTEGLARLLARLRASGLFTDTRTLPAAVPQSGFVTYSVELVEGGRGVTITAINAGASSDGRRLIELADSILDPPAPVDPADWADGDPTLHPYRARDSRLTLELVNLPAGEWEMPEVELARLAWPLLESPLAAGEQLTIAETPERTLRCMIVSGDDEARIRVALAAAGATGAVAYEDGLVGTWDLGVGALRGVLRVSLRPFLPGEEVGCRSAPLPEAPTPQPPPPPSFAEFWAAARGGRIDDGVPLVSVEVARGGEGGGDVASLVYTTGGQAIDRLHAMAPAVGAAVRTLSIDGIARLRALLDALDLPADIDEERFPADATPFTSYRLEGLLGGTWRSVTVTDWRPGRDAAQLIDLARRLVDPDAWAGSDGWRNGDATVHAWQPTWVELRVETYPDEPSASALVPASGVRWPLDGGLAAARCERIGFRDADAVVRALAAAGVQAEGTWSQGEYRLRGDRPDTIVAVALTPVVPGVGSCP